MNDFGWFLNQAARQKASLPLLSLGLCSGSLLTARFELKTRVIVGKKPVKLIKKTKSLMNLFLNRIAPELNQYDPARPAIYVYSDQGVKLYKVKEAEDLTESQLHALCVSSVHQFIPVSHSPDLVYKAKAWIESFDLLFHLQVLHTRKNLASQVTDSELLESVAFLLKTVFEVLQKTRESLKEVELDLVFDAKSSPVLLKVTKLLTSNEHLPIRVVRSAAVKECKVTVLKSEESLSISDSSIDFSTEPTNKKILSPSFLSMISRTIEKSRKKEEQQREKRQLTTLAAERQRSLRMQKQYRTNSLNKLKKQPVFTSVEGLIYYLEKTRPRIWARDLTGMMKSKNFHSAKGGVKHHRTRSKLFSSEILPVSCMLPPLQSTLRKNERYNHFLVQEASRIKAKHQDSHETY